MKLHGNEEEKSEGQLLNQRSERHDGRCVNRQTGQGGADHATIQLTGGSRDRPKGIYLTDRVGQSVGQSAAAGFVA